jgi:hypothetical protein
VNWRMFGMVLGQQGLNPNKKSHNSAEFPWPAASGILRVA